jgi:hypothetical protein
MCYTKYAIFSLTGELGSDRIKTMRVYEKVLLELDKRDWGIPRLHQVIVEQWGNEAIDYTTLWRVLSGKTTMRRFNHIYIASALGTTPRELRKGTNEEDKRIRFTYNEEAYLEYEKTALPYLTAKLYLSAKAKTEPESDPPEKGNLGTVSKQKFHEADSNGMLILEGLIKKGVLAENSSGRIYLIRKEGKSINRPQELYGDSFNEIWGILHQPPFTKWLYAIQGETICTVESPEGIQEFIIKAETEGTVEKSDFDKAAIDAASIVDELIKKGVLEEASDPKNVRLKRANSEHINRPHEITGSKFDRIWNTLQQFPSIYFDSTLPHHFENRGGKKSVCLIIQNPKYIP